MRQENQKIWYIFDEGVVTGPYDKEDMRHFAEKRPNPNAMVWARGHTDWQTVSSWVDAHLGWGDAWYINHGGMNSGPYPLSKILKSLRMGELNMNIKLWTMGLKRWVRPYDVHPLIKGMGLQARRHGRAPFVGEVKIAGLFNSKHVSAVSLSVGGLAVTNMSTVGKNAKVAINVSSELLPNSFEAKARVVYQKGSTAGLEFISLSPEALETVSCYMKQFDTKPIE